QRAVERRLPRAAQVAGDDADAVADGVDYLVARGPVHARRPAVWLVGNLNAQRRRGRADAANVQAGAEVVQAAHIAGAFARARGVDVRQVRSVLKVGRVAVDGVDHHELRRIVRVVV